MIDLRADSIIYQSQIYFRNLVNSLVEQKRVGKALDLKWDKADLILGYLEALNYTDRLTDEDDILDVNYILECLIKLCELNQYPTAAPLTFQPPPAIIVGEQGEPGIPGGTGATGATGLATDFQMALVSTPTIVDSFPITDANGVRWDYYIRESAGAQRVSSILGHWLPDGSEADFADAGAPELDGSTAGLEFSIQVSGGEVQLIATPTSGVWTVVGTRYFIPNNGNGTGPISDALLNGYIYIGNASDIAQGRLMSGVLNITNTGVTSFVAGSILNADINAAAAIELTKLATVTADRLLISNGAGQIITSSVTSTEAGYLSGVTSAIQTQLNTKLTDPSTTVGDLIIRNSFNTPARLGIGTEGQVLTTIGGLPVWSAASVGFSDPMTSIGDVIIRDGSNNTARLGIGATDMVLTVSGGVPVWAVIPGLSETVVEIGDWNMDSSSTKTVSHGIADFKTIREISVVVRNDADTLYTNFLSTGTTSGAMCGFLSTAGITGSTILLERLSTVFSGIYDSTDYDSTGYNRGWITIKYTT